MVPRSVSTSSWHWALGLASGRACRSSNVIAVARPTRDVAGRMRDEYDALIAEIKGERVARAVG